ncbi:MAG: hypothetical protein IPP47_22090 [Bryobacterales bacterium]|nr:hypothetical protein [Bryobacterales bacterium]
MIDGAGLARLSAKNEADCRAILKQDGDAAEAIEKRVRSSIRWRGCCWW